MEFSTKHIDYLSRVYLDEELEKTEKIPIPQQEIFLPSASSLAFLRLSGISRFWERVRSNDENPDRQRYRMEDVLIGCHGASLPLVFLVRGFSTTPEIEIDLGILDSSASKSHSNNPEDAIQFVGQSLPGHYPGIQTRHQSPEEISSMIEGISKAGFCGIVTGIPTMKVTDETDDPTQLDRLIRTMYGSDWGFMVIAQPYSFSQINSMLHSVLNEMRMIANAEQTKTAWTPVAKSYNEKLEKLEKEFEQGKSTGLWTTTIYYFSPDEWHFLKLGSAIRAYYGGETSGIDPIRTLTMPGLSSIVPTFGQPTVKPKEGPGQFRYPYQYQTLLNSRRLSVFVHLPRLEIPGFSINQSCYFDVVSHKEIESQLIDLGEILHYGGPIGSKYQISVKNLQKHALVVGVTGSGKTNTIFHLLVQLWELGIPFLVIEPAKTEYRALLTHENIGPNLRIFTLGEEQVSPMRINPFEVETGVSVATHIDLLKSVFNASFGMWNPLPQVLERCIHDIYSDRGWDTTRNINFRLESDSSDEEIDITDAYPTLTDLFEKISEIVNSLGYEERVESDIKAALMTRINSLRIGGKGIMLDTQHSMPISELLKKPTIIELEQIGDDDEKAFLMGLIMTRIYEYLRGHGSTEGTALKNVVVIEEAHRLLSNVPVISSPEQSNVRGKAVETFTNMLSEIRAYGEGFIVAEQIAVKLSPDVVKNTNLKIVHRTVAGEDRRILGETMNMDNQQCDMLAVLRTGQSTVFVEGDDKPIMVAVPYAKIEVPTEMKTKAGSDRQVAMHMQPFKDQPDIAPLFTPFADCSKVCDGSLRYCDTAKEIASDSTFQEHFAAFVLSIAVNREILESDYKAMLRSIRSRLSQSNLNTEALRCVILNSIRWYFDYFGRWYSWPYSTIHKLQRLLSNLLLTALPRTGSLDMDGVSIKEQVTQFREMYLKACLRVEEPYVTCAQICPDGTCLFRYHNIMLMRDKRLNELFDEGMVAAVDSEGWPDIRAIMQAVTRLNGQDMSQENQRSIGLCYGVLQLTYKPGMMEAARDLAIHRLMGTVL